jgi:ubiquinone/menaquinone biosynthesis C-methylase UbiE
MEDALLKDVMQWDVHTWRRALPGWQRALDAHKPAKALAIGERDGGLSLWLARQGIAVTCTDLWPFPETTAAMHERYGVAYRITYEQADTTALQFADESFDLVVFKSVIGALDAKEKQRMAVEEMHRVLKPGGELLFAENLAGTPLHKFLHRRFTGYYWNHLAWPADSDLFASFAHVQAGTTGLLANLGRSPRQRMVLARADEVLCRLAPSSWHYMVHGVCTKGR